MVEGKLPPQAIDIEEVFLGALLIEGDKFNDVKTILPDEAFYNEKNKAIYQAMRSINRKDGNIDILTITEKLRETGKLESIGGATYIASLSGRVSSAMHIKSHLAIIYDKWVARECIKMGSELVEQSYNTDDILDTLQRARNAMDTRILQFLGINSTGISIVDAADKSLDQYFKREEAHKKGKISGIPSTFRKLNKRTGGFQKGQLIVLAGRPGMGKTSLAISFMINAAVYSFKCAFFSLETSYERLMDKVICSIANISFSDYKIGRLSDDQKKDAENSLSLLEHWYCTLNDTMLTTIEQIHANCKKIKDRDGLDIVFIDYLQLIRTTEKTGNREQEVSTISRKAKLMAIELDLPVVLMSQLNRGVEMRADKRPVLSDLRESGAIEQDADIVMFAYRPAVYDETAPNDKGELLVRKHREGETGDIVFKHNEALTRFTDDDENDYDIDKLSPGNDKPF